MTELYTVMRYLQADLLKDVGIQHFDEWAADFGEVVIFCDLSTPKPESRQDCFYVFRKNLRKSLGYEVIRKKVGIKPDFGFDDVKKHIKENAQEDADKLKNGDIVVIRRPSQDMETIISEAAVYTDGVLIPDNSRLEDLEMSEIQEMPPKGFNVYDVINILNLRNSNACV